MHKPRKASSDVALISVFVRRPVADTDTQAVRLWMAFIDWRQARELGRVRVDVAIALTQLGFPHSKPEIQHSGHGPASVFEELEQELPSRSVETVGIACFEDWICCMLLSVPMAVMIAAAPP